MLFEWVTAPSLTRATFRIEAASGVETVNWVPSVMAPGAALTVGRGASSPDPSFLNR